MPTNPSDPINISEKDLKPLLADSPPITFQIHPTSAGEFFVTFTHKKKEYIPITTRGHTRTFYDLTRLIRWAEALGASRITMDIEFPLLPTNPSKMP